MSTDPTRCRLSVDGREILAACGDTIKAGATASGIEIPGLCHLPGREEASEPCRLCLVEADGRQVLACKTLVAEGMTVVTATPAIEQLRRQRLEFLSSFHYGDCKAPCNLTCPAGINVQGYVNYIAIKEYGAALSLIREQNPLPGIVCRVCPRFCESRCRRALIDEPVAINHLKRFAVEHGGQSVSPVRPGPSTGCKVAVLGGGPAGLSCAWYLRRFGHEVTIFEANRKLGGMARYGIPAFKLPDDAIDQEIENVLALGAHVRTGKRWGSDFDLAALQGQGFNAIFLATGIGSQKTAQFPGAELALDALALLREFRSGHQPTLGARTLVIGGGKIAVEAARSALRAGAEEVTVVYPRSKVEINAHQRDIKEAEREGVQFFMMAQPLRILRENGLIRVEMARTILSEANDRGIRESRPMENSSLWWEGDTVLAALGQVGDGTFAGFGELESKLQRNPNGTIKISPATMRTNLPGIYAGGDLASGPRSVIQAVDGGRRAAEAIHEELTGQKVVKPADGRMNFSRGRKFEEVDVANFAGHAIRLRESIPARPPDRRLSDFGQVELGYSEDMAIREAQRCLQCGCLGLSKCELRPLLNQYKVQTKAALVRPRAAVDAQHPFIVIDANCCIGCGRCERSCEFEAMTMRLKTATDGGPPSITLDIGPNCVSCGACVDACPTGALTKKHLTLPLLPGEATQVQSVCTYCGTGCNIDLHVKNNVLLEVKADNAQPPNHGDLCVRGRFGFDFYRHPERLTQPLVRDSIEKPFRKASWQEALAWAAGGLKKALNHCGGEGVGVLSSSRCENEVNYVAQKFARLVLKTKNVDNCARVCHAPSVSGLRIALGSGAATNSLDNIALAEVLLISGSNTSEGHPVVGMKVKRAVKNGAKLIVIDPRRTEMAAMADLWLRLIPGTNVLLLNSLLHAILDEGIEDKEFIAARTENLEMVRAHVQDYSPEAMAARTGVDPALVRAAARLYCSTKLGMILYGLGMTEHRNGTQGVMGLANIALASGNIGRPGAGICPLRGQNNVQGSCDMGALPYVYSGYQDVADDQARERLSQAWGAELPTSAGMIEPEMYEAALRGRFKGMYCIGYDPVHTQADINKLRQAFSMMEMVVVQDIFLTETAKLAHVVLPAACFYEKDGTFTNAERRVRRIRKAVLPVGQALPDWQITCRLAEAMGHPMRYDGAEQVMEEIARTTPSMGGIHYERLEGEGLVWPCPHNDHPGTPILHQESFTRGKGRFSVLANIETLEKTDADYPFILITGRRLAHYNNGSMTRRCHGLLRLVPEETVEIHPDDADCLGIVSGMMVEIVSRRGAIRLPAVLTERSRLGTVFTAFHFPDPLVNTITSPGKDEIAEPLNTKPARWRLQR